MAPEWRFEYRIDMNREVDGPFTFSSGAIEFADIQGLFEVQDAD